jgi:membrane-associated protein
VLLNATHLLETYGVAGIGVILFLETGVLLGLLLPGETLTILAGAYSRGGSAAGIHLNLGLVIVAAAAGAIAGGQLGFLLGRRAGPALFERRDGRVFRRSHLLRTRAYFERFGRSTILIARFVPFVRTFASPAAGAAGMPAVSFTAYNALGGVAWALAVATLGYLLAGVVSIDRYALVVTICIAAVSLVPLVLHLRAVRRQT